MDYGKKLKELRIKHNMSQEELGKEIGIDRSIISRLENGNVQPSIEQIELYCEYFNIPFEKMVHNKDNTNENVNKLLNYIYYITASFAGMMLSPFGIIICFICLILSIKNKIPFPIKLFIFVSFLFCLSDVLFLFGIDLFPGIIVVS